MSANVWVRVLALPPLLAAMMPYLAMAARTQVMPHSRSRISTVKNHGSSPRMLSETKAAPVSALSATGSHSLPKSVTRLYFRAMLPSATSVSIASTKTMVAHSRHVKSSGPMNISTT